MPPRRTPGVILAVWDAKDGRWEACTRPMDKRLARVARIDDDGAQSFENLHLLCVNCRANRPDPPAQLSVIECMTRQMVGSPGPEQAQQAMQWLRGRLQRRAVSVAVSKTRRRYLVPGVTTFEVALDSDGSAWATVTEVGWMPPQPAGRVKPQARRCGLTPALRQPLGSTERATQQRTMSAAQRSGAEG